ncbi:MAG: enoyl-CoA hydratase [Chloroflexota bacterium]
MIVVGRGASPRKRNALTSDLLRSLTQALDEAERDEAVGVVVLTGTDPAFCAGLDLREFSDPAAGLIQVVRRRDTRPWAALASMSKPVIGAVNGPAVTGGLELALACDFLVASERARFADTHARFGVLPGQGMVPNLIQAVGPRRAREMSFTGRFVGAEEALSIGLVNKVVPHEELLPLAGRLAAEITANDQAAVRKLKALYDRGSRLSAGECVDLEQREFLAWQVEPEEIARRRSAVTARGSEAAG